jgi:hypothetical protein
MTSLTRKRSQVQVLYRPHLRPQVRAYDLGFLLASCHVSCHVRHAQMWHGEVVPRLAGRLYRRTGHGLGASGDAGQQLPAEELEFAGGHGGG